MMMRSKVGAAAAAASSAQAQQRPAVPALRDAPPWLKVGNVVSYLEGGSLEQAQPVLIKAIHTDDPPELYCTISMDGGSGAERQTPISRLCEWQPAKHQKTSAAAAGTSSSSSARTVDEAGEGPVAITVVQGKREFLLRCTAEATVRSLKELLAPLTGADAPAIAPRQGPRGDRYADGRRRSRPRRRRRRRQRQDDASLPRRHHREVAGAEAVASCVGDLAALKVRVEKARHQITKRLLSGAEALATLGGLDDEVAAILQDLQNAAPNESSEAAAVRAARLTECEAMQHALAAQGRPAQAELMGQIGR